MRLLLDTHALLWWLADAPALGSRARALIEDPGNDIDVSIASLWEIVIKIRIGKLDADVGEIVSAIDAQGMRVLGIRPAHLHALATLPRLHRDPFDQLLVAHAMVEGATLMTDDRQIALYPGTRVGCSDGPAGTG